MPCLPFSGWKPKAFVGVNDGRGGRGPLRMLSASSTASRSASVAAAAPPVRSFFTMASRELDSSRMICPSVRSITRRSGLEMPLACAYAVRTAPAMRTADPRMRALFCAPTPRMPMPAMRPMIASEISTSTSVTPAERRRTELLPPARPSADRHARTRAGEEEAAIRASPRARCRLSRSRRGRRPACRPSCPCRRRSRGSRRLPCTRS